ncbi:MAG: glycosyltransferase, partial [Candidatus Helarchaeota archaeon]
LSQELEDDFELKKILVVASGCTDRTPQLVEEFEKKFEIVNLICEDERRGKASALNTIFNELKSDILILMGGDVLPRKGCLKELIRSFNDPLVGAVSGHPIPINKPTKFADTVACLIWDLHHIFSNEIDVKLTGELFAMRGGVINQILSRVNCDDALIEFLLKRSNYQIRYAPKAIVDIKGPENIRDLIVQRRRIHAGHR